MGMLSLKSLEKSFKKMLFFLVSLKEGPVMMLPGSQERNGNAVPLVTGR